MAAVAKKLSQLEAQFEPARVELNAAEIDALLSKWRSLNQGEDSALECLVRADMQLHLDLLGRARMSNDVEAERLLGLISQNSFSSATSGSQELDSASSGSVLPWIRQESTLLAASLTVKKGEVIAEDGSAVVAAGLDAARAAGARTTLRRAAAEYTVRLAIASARAMDFSAGRAAVEAALKDLLDAWAPAASSAVATGGKKGAAAVAAMDRVAQNLGELLVVELMCMMAAQRAHSDVVAYARALLLNGVPLALSAQGRRRTLLALAEAELSLDPGSPFSFPSVSVAKDAPSSALAEAAEALLAMDSAGVPLDGAEERRRCRLMALALIRLGRVEELVPSLQQSLVYRFGDYQIWFQLAMALHMQGAAQQALAVLRECMALAPRDPVPAAFAARLCVNELGDPELAVQYGKRAIECGGGAEAHMVLGVAYGLYAIRRVHSTVSRRSELLELAAQSLEAAHGLAPRNASLVLHLALVLADKRDVERATEYVWRALALQPRSAAAWTLAALLQSSRRQYRDALETCDAALRVLPDELPRFAVVKGKLYFALGRYAEALACYRDVFVWKARQGAAAGAAESAPGPSSGSGAVPDGGDVRSERTRSIVPSVSMDFSDLSSVRDDIGGRGGEPDPRRSMDSIGSGGGGGGGGACSDKSLLELWVLCSEAYRALGDMDSAWNAHNAADAIQRQAAVLLYNAGMLFEKEGRRAEALQAYQAVLSVNASYVPCLLRVACVQLEAADYHAAESTALAVLRADPAADEAWLHLGQVYQALGDAARSLECLEKAVRLEATRGVLPYSTISRVV